MCETLSHAVNNQNSPVYWWEFVQEICQYFRLGKCQFGDKCKNAHVPDSPQQGGSASCERQEKVVKAKKRPDDLVKVSCAYGQRDHKSVVFSRKVLQNCTWSVSALSTYLGLAWRIPFQEALLKFRQEFTSISCKKTDKICFEGRFSQGGDDWARVPSQDFA